MATQTRARKTTCTIQPVGNGFVRGVDKGLVARISCTSLYTVLGDPEVTANLYCNFAYLY